MCGGYMSVIKKALLAATLSAAVATTATLGGCFLTGVSTKTAVPGKDGQDVSIYEIYDATNKARAEEGLEQLTFLQFVDEYLNYSSEDMQEITSLQATMNRSLLSAVSIITQFEVGRETQQYAGSGVIIDIDKTTGDMTVVTNCHVVYLSSARGDGYCDDINLYFYGCEYYESNRMKATIIGTSKSYDIAVIKVSGSSVVENSHAEAAEWADCESVYLGEQVYAVGNPEGDKMSITAGIISKDSQYITVDLEDTSYNDKDDYSYRVLRTDTAINSGNSGGALFNKDGKVMGIINAKSVSEGIDNMGFALPSSTSRRVVKLILDGYSGSETHGIMRPMLNITSSVVASSSRFNNTTNLTEIYEQVEVKSVSSNSMFKGKLEVGDVLRKIKITGSNGNIKELRDLDRDYFISDVMLSARVGDTVELTVLRGENEISMSAVLTSSDLVSYA